jgi:hypothetical protein
VSFVRLAIAALLALAACADPADRAAKTRVFSPEEPDPALLRAKEPIDVTKADTSAAVLSRVLTMDRLEAARRLGAHRALTTIRFNLRRGDRTVSLSEKHELWIDADGQYRAVTTNDQDAGLEVIYAGGQAFVKNRYGPFRLRRMDRAQQDAWRDRATPALATLASFVGDRLRLAAGPTVEEGRPRHRYTWALGDAAAAPAPSVAVAPAFGTYRLPGDETVHPGPDPDTARRLDFAARKEIRALTGTLDLDDAAGVAVASQARLRAEVAGEGGPATLELEFAYEAILDPAVKITPPTEVAPARIAHAINEPLWFLGPGAAAPKSEDEPASDSGDDEVEPAEAAPAAPADKAPAPRHRPRRPEN